MKQDKFLAVKNTPTTGFSDMNWSADEAQWLVKNEKESLVYVMVVTDVSPLRETGKTVAKIIAKALTQARKEGKL